MADLSYRGQALRDISASFEMGLTDTGLDVLLNAGRHTERLMVLSRPEGRTWRETPHEQLRLRRGRRIDVEVNVGGFRYVLRGRIRYRRLHRLVVEGQLDG